MSNLAIIPARGGSKRIPGKNIRDFLGKPIIAYTIEIAFQSNLFEEVMVSTDDEPIAQIARQYGAKVPFMRSAENSSDYATTLQVIEEVLINYKLNLDLTFDLVCCIYPAAPLIEPKDLEQGLNILKKNKFPIVFPIVRYGYPIWRGLERDNDGITRMIWPENSVARSQDLKKVYHDAGQWYWIDPSKFSEDILKGEFGTVIMDELNVQDIDNKEDWILAELKYKLKHDSKYID